MKHLIILSQAPLTKQIKRNSYLDEFINAGYTNTEFWDISQYIHPGVKLCDVEQYELTRFISNINELTNAIDKINVNNSIFILDFSPSWDTKEIFLTLSNRGCTYVRIDMYANTTLYISKLERFSKILSLSLLISIIPVKFKNLMYSIYAKRKNIRPFEKYYSSSSLKIVNCTNKINHPDYEEYKFTSKKRIIEGNYILFVDTYWGYHPDLKYIYKSNISKLNPLKYQASLNQYFTFVEKKYKMPVIIAVHPKANYPKGSFENRIMIKYKTMDLITFASMIILQICNTISWVLLADKPVALVTNDEYNKTPRFKFRLKTLSKVLGLQVYNIDSYKWDDIIFRKVNSRNRIDYLYTYLTDKETEQKRNVNILTQSFETL